MAKTFPLSLVVTAQTAQAAKAITELQKQLAGLSRAQKADPFAALSKGAKASGKEIDSLTKKLGKVGAVQFKTDPFAQMVAGAKAAEKLLGVLSAKLAATQTAGAKSNPLGGVSAGARAAVKEVDALGAKLKAVAKTSPGDPFKSMTSGAGSATKAVSGLADKLKAVDKAAGDPFKAMVSGANAAAKATDSLGAKVKSALTPPPGNPFAGLLAGVTAASNAVNKLQGQLNATGARQPGAQAFGPLDGLVNQAKALNQLMPRLNSGVRTLFASVASGARTATQAVGRLNTALGATSRPAQNPFAQVTSGATAAAAAVQALTRQLQAASNAASRNAQAPRVPAVPAAVPGVPGVNAGAAGGVVAGAGLLTTAKNVLGTAISLESALADVAKVTGASNEQIATLKDNLIKLSREIPVSQAELAKIAATAGQMGVAVKDLPEFVALTAKAATAFGMLPQEAADAFSTVQSVLRLNQRELSSFADTVNTLGNNFAASERAILDVVGRIGGTARVIGLTREQMAAFATATLPLVGGASDRAATALNALMSRLSTMQDADPKALAAFESLGISAKDFTKALNQDAAKAIDGLFARLKKLRGTDLTSVLSQAFGREVADELASLVGAYDDVSRAQALASDTTKTYGAVQKEFATRVETTEAQLGLMLNSLRESAEEVGQNFLPFIVSAAKSLAELSQAVAGLAAVFPDGTRYVVGMVAGLATLRAGAAAIAFLLPGIAASVGAAGAAAGTAGGLFSKWGRVIGGLVRGLGSLTFGMAGLIALLPAFAESVSEAQAYGRAVSGSSKSAEEAERALAGVRAEMERLNKTFEDDKGSAVFRSKLAQLEAAEASIKSTIKSLNDAEAKERAAAVLSEAEARRAAAIKNATTDSERRAATVAARRGETYLPPPPPGLPPLDTQAGGPKIDAALAKAEAAAERARQREAQAQLEFDAAEINSAKKKSDTLLELQRAQLDRSLAQSKISQGQYLQQKAAQERAELQAERARIEALVKLYQERAADPELSADKVTAAKQKVAELQAELTSLGEREETVQVRLEIDQAALQEELNSFALDLRTNILDAKGNPLQASLDRLSAQTAEQLRKYGDNPTLVALIEENAEFERQRLHIEENERLIRQRGDTAAQVEANIALAVEKGEITSLEAEKAIQASRLKSLELTRDNVEALEQLALANEGNIDLMNRAASARLEYEQALFRATRDPEATRNNEMARDAMRETIQLAMQGKSVFEALRTAWANALAKRAEGIADALIDDMFRKMEGAEGQSLGGSLARSLSGGLPQFFKELEAGLSGAGDWLKGVFSGGAGGGQSGIGSFFSAVGGWLGFASGGYTGNGGKFDPAGTVHRGEFVLPQEAVRRLGLPFLYSLMKPSVMRRSGGPGYANGGAVVGGGISGALLGAASSLSSSHTANLTVNLDGNTIARTIAKTSEFERGVKQVKATNGNFFRS